MVDFIITDFESVRGGGNIVDTVPSAEDFIVDNCTISSVVSGEFVLTPGESLVANVWLTANKTSITVGESVVFSAFVEDTDGEPLEGLTVSFYRDGVSLGSGVSDDSGLVQLTVSSWSVGSFTCTASCQGVTSSAVTVTVNKSTSTISLSASSASASYGTSITLSGTLSVGSGASVKLYKEMGLLDTLTTGTGGAFSFSTSTLPVGSHSFTAVYEGDSSHTNVTSSAVSVTITKITSTISLSAVSSTISVGDSPQLTGTLSVGSGESVKIYLGDVLVDTVTTGTNGAFSFTGSATSTSGSLTFKAVYDGDSTHSSVTSSNVVITVSGSTPVVDSVSLTSDKSILSAYDSESAVLSATVLDDNDDPMEGETVTFYKGSTSIGTATTNSSGIATKSYSATGAGDVTFTASVGMIVSETYSIEDCIKVGFNGWTGTFSTGTDTYDYITPSTVISPNVSLPSAFKVNYKFKNTNNSNASTGSGLWNIGPNTSNGVLIGHEGTDRRIRIYSRSSGNNTVQATENYVYSYQTWTDAELTYQNGTISITVGSKTASYSLSSAVIMQFYEGYTKLRIAEWKIKPL